MSEGLLGGSYPYLATVPLLGSLVGHHAAFSLPYSSLLEPLALPKVALLSLPLSFHETPNSA